MIDRQRTGPRPLLRAAATPAAAPTLTEAPHAATDAETSPTPSDYAGVLGDRLRTVRQQQGLSLHNVEERSDGDLKASVVGAYERGERAVSVARLRVIADFYRVPISELLPASGADVPRHSEARGGLRLDLTRLERADVPERGMLDRFARTIQTRRGDYNGRILTLRADDLQALAAVLGMSCDELEVRLERVGIARPAAA